MIIAACPDGWGWEWNPKFSKCYYYIREWMTGIVARERCMELDPEATLTSIRSQEENDYIYSFYPSGYTPWIGGTDEEEEGIWRWVNLSVYELVASRSLALIYIICTSFYCFGTYIQYSYWSSER